MDCIRDAYADAELIGASSGDDTHAIAASDPPPVSDGYVSDVHDDVQIQSSGKSESDVIVDSDAGAQTGFSTHRTGVPVAMRPTSVPGTSTSPVSPAQLRMPTTTSPEPAPTLRRYLRLATSAHPNTSRKM